jgi:capsular exopolysaccharide synthesis family protein
MGPPKVPAGHTETHAAPAQAESASHSAERCIDSCDRSFKIDQVAVDQVVIAPESRIVYFLEPDSPGADRFRLLRMRLAALKESNGTKTLLITSACERDGKSTIALNLATALAERGQKRVVLVEGDLHHAGLTETLRLRERAGLAEYLEKRQKLVSVLRRIEPLGWYLLPAGEPRANPTELLQLPTVSDLFASLRPHFDWILIDTPPVNILTDTLSWRQHSDASLLVVRAGQTRCEAVEEAVSRVRPHQIAGLVLNGAEELGATYADYRKSYGARRRANKFR